MSDENQDEYYDGGEPDYDYDEMNKQMILGLNNNMENTNNNIKNDEISTIIIYLLKLMKKIQNN